MSELLPYDRISAIAYAHRWAFDRNPAYYNYETVGGDCTNYASQVLFAGSGVMNYTPTYGWYYIDANQKSPSWSGVPYFYDFLIRNAGTGDPGPFGREVGLSECVPGDFLQLNFDGSRYAHTPVIVEMSFPVTPETILLAAHDNDADYRPLSTYTYQSVRGIHILGVYR